MSFIKLFISVLIMSFSTSSFAQFPAPTKLPVSELHVHADGGIINQQMFEHLVKKNGLNLKSSDYYVNGVITPRLGDFKDFLRVYDVISSVVQTKEDITYIIYEYLKQSAAHGAIYTELMISPDHYSASTHVYTQPGDESKKPELMRTTGFSYAETIAAVAAGIDKARHDFGIEARIDIAILRHEGVDAANKLLDKVIAHPHPYVVGINLAGDDINYPAAMFKDVYARAKKHGLKLTAHMGEHTGPEDMLLAIDMQLDRVGHGLSVIDNPEILKKFKATGIGIESCPSSNMDKGYGKFNTMDKLPLKTMLQHGLKVAISTDDPSFNPTDIEQEYLMVQKAYHLSNDKMIELCENSIKMSFADDALKAKLLKKIEHYKETVLHQNQPIALTPKI